MARGGTADLQKVAIIFQAFDVDKDARLNGLELTKLIQQCNPSVCFSVVQLEAIVQEVSSLSRYLTYQCSSGHAWTLCDHALRILLPCTCMTLVLLMQVLQQYEGSEQAPGLTRQSLAQLYMDGVADCDIDFHTMQMTEPSPAKACVVQFGSQCSQSFIVRVMLLKSPLQFACR